MEKIKVLCVFGTRPEAIKMAPVILGMENDEEISTSICVTGQHRELLEQVTTLFKIHPDIDLELMQENQSLRELTINILNALDNVFDDISPDWVLVQGDTTTVMATALLAYYKRIKVGHIEAGLRTYDIYQPFPEEANRRIAGFLSNLHFAPTENAANNLLREGVQSNNVFITGNTVIDAVNIVSKLPFDKSQSLLRDLEESKPLVLVTSHRRENFGKPLQNICTAIQNLALKFGDKYHFVFPVHPNPNVQKIVFPALQNNKSISLMPPLQYRELIYLIEKSVLILSDSGGIQEEAPALHKPVLILREKTERPEGVEVGIARLVGTDPEKIFSEANLLLTNPENRAKMMKSPNPYGDGRAAERIISAIKGF